MEFRVNGQVITLGETEKNLLRATASQDPVGIAKRQEIVNFVSAAWRAGVLEPDLLAGIYDRIPLEVGAEAKFPLDLYTTAKQGQYMAFVCPKEGAIPDKVVESDEVWVPTYKIANAISWALEYPRDARWDVIARALEVFSNGFVQKMNDDGWHVILKGAIANTVQQDTAATAGIMTRNLISLMQVYMKRLVSGVQNNGRLTDLYISPEAVADLRSMTYAEVDDVTQRQLITQGEDQLPQLYGVKLHELQQLGVGQEYELYVSSTLSTAHTNSDVENVIGFDLLNRDSFVMPVRENMQMFDDPTLHRGARAGVYGWAEVGFACLDTRRVIRGSF